MEESRKIPDLWLPVLVGLVGVLVSLAGWGLLVAERREQLLAASRATAAETGEAVEIALARQIETLAALRDLWSEFGLPPVAEWRAQVRQRVDRMEGLTSVSFVGVDDPQRRRSVETEGSAPAVEIEADDPGLRGDRPLLEGPRRDATGGVGYRVFLPLREPAGSAGVLVADFHVAPLLESALRARARGYALSVLWDGEEIFARGVPSADPWQRWWRVDESIALPLGGSWRLVQRPTPGFAAARLTPLPHYLLAAGFLLSAVLAVLAHQLRLVLRQSRFLAASNRALEERGMELEIRVAERTEELEDAVKELEAFNYSVSHDLRSPLGAILNFTAILEEDYRGRAIDDQGERLLGRIRASATRATQLLEDLLRLSRAGRGALSFETVDMAALAREIFAQVRAAQDDADVDLVIGPLPEAVGDRSLLGDVLANLFGNALKYSRGCEKRRIALTGRMEDGACVYEVADNGQGFDMRFVDKLFGVFERLHAQDEIGGTGVGLAIVARIVKRHGGRAWAEGAPGEGARFSFALPRREAP